MRKQQFETMKSSAQFLGEGNVYETGLHQYLTEDGHNLSKSDLLTIAIELCYASHLYMEPEQHNRFNAGVLTELKERLVD